MTYASTNVPAVSTLDCEHRLRTVLRVNVASSAISGLVMAVAPGTIDGLLDTGHPGVIRLVGLALLPFAAAVFWLASADLHLLRRFTPAIVAGDVAWVVASIVTVFVGWYSGGGVAAVLAMALMIDVFALLQFNAWRHLQRD